MFLQHRWVTSDRIAVALAHRAGDDFDKLAEIDQAEAEAYSILRRGPASLHRQHPRPNYHHHRHPTLAGVFS